MRARSIQTGLVLASVGYLASASAGAYLAITSHLPARFAVVMHGSNVARDFLLFQGTGLSPNLAMLLGQLALTGCVPRRDRAGTYGVIGLAALGAAYTIGQLGEPIAREAFRPATRNPSQAAIVTANVAFPLAMVVLGLLEWRHRTHLSQRASTRSEAYLPGATGLTVSSGAGGLV